MTDIATALKSEITRLARRELRREMASLKKTVAAHRSEIAELKRQLKALAQEGKRAAKSRDNSTKPAAEGDTVSHRFSAKGFASLRRKLDLSAEEVGLLVGASGASVYNWERGIAHPRAKHLPAIAALRSMGKREAASKLEDLKAAA